MTTDPIEAAEQRMALAMHRVADTEREAMAAQEALRNAHDALARLIDEAAAA